VPTQPSSFATLAGATVVANLSASNIVIGKVGYRRQLVSNQSARCLAAYLYSAAGLGESTTDLAWDGHAIIYENGTLIAESQRFADTPQLAAADIDLGRLLAVIDPATDTAVYSYDAVGNLTGITRQTSSTLALFPFTPGTGPAGTAVTISGTGFSATPASNTVKFNGTTATVATASTTVLTTTVPAGATTGAISVTNPDGTATSATNFTVTASPVPTITSFHPTSGPVGTSVLVTGTASSARPR